MKLSDLLLWGLFLATEAGSGVGDRAVGLFSGVSILISDSESALPHGIADSLAKSQESLKSRNPDWDSPARPFPEPPKSKKKWYKSCL